MKWHRGAAHRDMYLDDNGEVKTMDSLFGVRASGVPGSVAGMWAAHKKYGSLPWRRLVQPAIDLAENGFVVHPKLGKAVEEYQRRVREKGITNNFADYFAQAKSNTLFRQPELARTLTRIRDEGRKGFYAGETARLITQYMQQNNGLITLEDLDKYQAIWRKPVTIDWQDYTLITAPPPSSGGVAVAQWLGMMQDVGEKNSVPEHNSVAYIHQMSEVGKRVFADRAKYLGDPDFIDVPVAELIDDDYIASRAAQVNIEAISDSDKIGPGLHESEQTTHFSIVDKWGTRWPLPQP